MMRKPRLFFLLLCVSLFPFAGEGAGTAVAEGVAAMQETDTTGYDVHWYFLQLSANIHDTYLAGVAEIRVTVTADTLRQMVLELTPEMTVDSVRVGGVPVAWTHDGDLLLIGEGEHWAKGDSLRTQVFYHGLAPTGGFFSAVTSKEDETWHQRVTWTLSEPFAAKDWFPCKQDLRDKADSSAVWITADTGLVAGSNGLLTGVDTLGGGDKVRYRWHHRHPIDYYLISFSLSPYRVFDQYAHNIRREGDSLLIRNLIYNDPEFLSRNRDNLEAVPVLIGLFSRLFIPYPFADEKYGHCLAPMGGGMEHQTMTTLAGLGFLIVAHEMTHQWFGDYVTCASWQDIWINEGFASYGEYLALENLKTQEEAGDWMVQAHDEALKEPDGSVYIPLEETGDVWRIFSGRLSYKKGASILHMIRYELDDDSLFFRVLRSYLQEYGDSTATGKDFEGVLERLSGEDFSWFFDQWYYGRGYPLFSFSWYQRQDTLFITSEQSPSGSTPFFRTHLDFLIHSAAGDTLVRFLQDTPQQQFVVPLAPLVSRVTVDPYDRLLKKISSVSHVIDPGHEGDIHLFPNPAGDVVNIYLFNAMGPVITEVMNLQGQVVMEKRFMTAPCRLPLTSLSPGLYLLRIRNGHNVWIRKLVVRR